MTWTVAAKSIRRTTETGSDNFTDSEKFPDTNPLRLRDRAAEGHHRAADRRHRCGGPARTGHCLTPLRYEVNPCRS
ncbi:hypothetical protein OG609_37225 [Streptomyces sp. NBC_01224]|uniref:hypothetical protein n=1 Tax=Streptomyces sp. NBC_01224 TaxID=2903783 RepID=UPI002E1313D1|nr:hypothetical protein OG609_37225 [Streptomyces sp. NBC_01224]